MHSASASRLVMSYDSHAREPRSRLGGSSWHCNNTLQSSMKQVKVSKERESPPTLAK